MGLTKILKGAAVGTALLLCGASAAYGATFKGERTDFRDETIYFVITTRFYDGDTGNNTYCWDGKKNVNDPEWRGDFKGLIEKLDYIKALGFTAVWITPVVENASGLDYHGYHAFNFGKVDPRYESQDCKFQDLIDAAHARGMKIVLDIVLNHNGNFGEERLCPMFEKDYSQNLSNINKSMVLHPQTKLPASYMGMNGSSQYNTRLALMKNTQGVNNDTHNYWHHVGNNWGWDDASRWWAQIAGDCVDLNTENPAVSNYLVDCYTKFIEMGVDGFRIDTGGHISRLTFNKSFIPQFQAAAEKYKDKRGGTPFFMYAEVCARAEEVIYRNENYNCSPCFYTWKETKDYAWDTSETSWDKYVVMEGGFGDHTNAQSVLQQGKDYAGHSNMPTSNNALLNGNSYRTEDYSRYSGLNVIDFPMHWRFYSAENAFNVRSQDNLYNDARYNVVYVDSHDYSPNGESDKRFNKGADVWAENLDLMFAWRGIPCLYYGSEIEFRKGATIDKGADMALKDGGRAYFGGYLTGSANVTDFAEYTGATGNMAATLSHPLALHIQRLNKIRAAVPALRKGQYSTDGCSGKLAFKRRYTDSNTDSYALVTISGSATFTGVENGTYTDVVTGDVKTVTNGTLTASCSGKGNMRVYVLSTAKTPAPGKIGTDGKYLYGASPVTVSQPAYDGHQEDGESTTQRDTSTGGNPNNPGTPNVTNPTDPDAEWTVYFDNSSTGWSNVYCYIWDGGDNFAEFLGKWPGTKMTRSDFEGQEAYKITFKPGRTLGKPMVIFNNGSNAAQTADLDLYNASLYNAAGWLRAEGSDDGKDDGVADAREDETGVKIGFEGGRPVAISATACALPAYRLDGTVVMLNLTAGRNDLSHLERGLYIIAGKKVVI
ncbi:MAG: starch-binding protein [Muribaculaceae bacterium]|nr:starch-binding protein [Muribaculaceae bacterium]